MQEYASPSLLHRPSHLTIHFNSPRRRPLKFDTSAFDILQNKWRQKDAQLEEDLKPKIPPLPKSLPPSDDATVQRLLEKRGPIAKFAREAVEDKDIVRLRPGQWLNDEIINFYGAMILGRAEASKENVPKVNGRVAGGTPKRGTPLNAHYFSSFFWSKMTKDGYDKGRLAKWTKKVYSNRWNLLWCLPPMFRLTYFQRMSFSSL
jgi:sentrin-specific protease 1